MMFMINIVVHQFTSHLYTSLYLFQCSILIINSLYCLLTLCHVIFYTKEELRVRSKYLNGNLETALGQHLLLPTTKEQGLIFDPKLIKMVMVYHNNLERPEGTFAVIDRDAQAKEEALEKRLKLSELSALPRDECSSCMSRKQVYCGECKGVRMANAEHLLPPRVTLPFDVLLLIDWCVVVMGDESEVYINARIHQHIIPYCHMPRFNTYCHKHV